MAIPLVNPSTHNALVARGDALYDSVTDVRVAPVVDSLPRFCDMGAPEAESWAFEWNTWEHTLSDARSTGDAKYREILSRTHFGELALEGRTILECGCGGGDDTEVLLRLPFSEVHAIDLSRAIDRAHRYLKDERLVLSQASIYAIPYRDRAFDVVFCHRVLQHTPDPPRALRALCKKVKPGGVLFVHSYNKSWFYLMNYKYKYRFLSKRLPPGWIYALLQRYGRTLYRLTERMRTGNVVLQGLSWSFVPFDWVKSYGNMNAEQRLDLLKLVTFDALTPRYDRPMRWQTMRRILEDEGFIIRFAQHRYDSPLLCTAVRR